MNLNSDKHCKLQILAPEGSQHEADIQFTIDDYFSNAVPSPPSAITVNAWAACTSGKLWLWQFFNQLVLLPLLSLIPNLLLIIIKIDVLLYFISDAKPSVASTRRRILLIPVSFIVIVIKWCRKKLANGESFNMWGRSSDYIRCSIPQLYLLSS